jgi:hypothetical protein
MRHDVLVQFDDQTQVQITVDGDDLPAADAARAWLDGEFTRLECEPLRPSGKLLTADKLLALALEAGRSGFEDPAWRQAFGRAVAGQLQRPTVTIDLRTMKVGS